MKTDPKLKQYQYYARLKYPRKTAPRASTVVCQTAKMEEEVPSSRNLTSHVSFHTNTILQRRTPTSTPQSSPLICQTLRAPLPKSHFNQLKQQPSFSSSEEADGDYFKNF